MLSKRAILLQRLFQYIIRLVNRPIVLLVLAVPAHCRSQGGPQNAPGVSSAVRKLAVEVSRGGFGLPQTDIFVINSPRSKPKRLVEGLNPTWSPDGEKIAYCVRDGRGFGQIQLINADGSGHTQLTNIKGGACPTDWSPDGEKIAFIAYGATPSIFVMGKNGDNVSQIIAGYGAKWSPDGKQQVFCRSPEGRGKSDSIWIANADGTGATKVIEDDSQVLEVAWSPDGKSVVSRRNVKTNTSQPCSESISTAVASKTLAVDKQISLFFPVPSPDGTRLLADAFAKGSSEGNVVQVDLATHHASVLAHGIHPSVLWEKR